MDAKPKRDGGKTPGYVKVITVVLACVVTVSIVIAALSSAGATQLASVQIAAPSPSPDSLMLAYALSDAEVAEAGTVLDETGLTLAAAQFAFVDVENAEEMVQHEVSGFKVGARDEHVIQIKERLMELGYLESDDPTDYYGEQTAYAMQLFQWIHGLSETGIADDHTLNVLFSDNAMSFVVSAGMSGTDVEQLQARLKELGYLSVKVTGYFGSDTQKAVQAFQKANKLTADGKIGNQTREALYAADAVTAKQAEEATKTATPTKTATKTPTPATSTPKPETSQEASTEPTPTPDAGLPSPDSGRVETFIQYASTLLGKKYVLGGKGPDVFDCSGFVYYALNQSGVLSIRYMTSAGWASSSYPTVKNKNDLQRGDILCFNGHVGIYLGGGQMLDASSDEGKIRITSNIWNKSYWNKNFKYGKRALY